ncbi:MAG: hypothetical protein AVDCRST_MAG66-3677 [uncultured Pseudonocardia sp.]|uniref:Uncharacterized protein n=1 Tax=uncultured Pseudonocardia sp. TaxID=211455 RepID=A0A6J4Q7L1_9PSEU|nr:MAG: hypothetical protein AVDCRST_MAG66-3677 [uncultured Pseudonocardia sp.]
MFIVLANIGTAIVGVYASTLAVRQFPVVQRWSWRASTLLAVLPAFVLVGFFAEDVFSRFGTFLAFPRRVLRADGRHPDRGLLRVPAPALPAGSPVRRQPRRALPLLGRVQPRRLRGLRRRHGDLHLPARPGQLRLAPTVPVHDGLRARRRRRRPRVLARRDGCPATARPGRVRRRVPVVSGKG